MGWFVLRPCRLGGAWGAWDTCGGYKKGYK